MSHQEALSNGASASASRKTAKSIGEYMNCIQLGVSSNAEIAPCIFSHGPSLLYTAEYKELGALCNDLDVCATDWKTLGTALRLKKGTLKVIEGVTNPVRNWFTRILETWLDTASPTKTELLTALRSACVGPEERVAKTLEDSGTGSIYLRINIYTHEQSCA